MILKAPERITYTNGHSFCPGCGHGVAIRLIGEVLDELGLNEETIAVLDVACGGLPIDIWRYDTIEAAHGRPVDSAIGVKAVRSDYLTFAYLGDGAAYSIGISETLHSARRNDPITVIVINNCVYGMTGGQTSPTSLDGQKTASDIFGKTPESSGEVFDVMPHLAEYDIGFLARGLISGPAGIARAKTYIKKAFETQMKHGKYSFVELLSACPTNWGLEPQAAHKILRESVSEVFKTGIFKEVK